MKSKLSHGLEVKSADKGEVTAVIATLNIKDLDGDVATAETFTEGQEVVISSYNHSAMYGAAVPVGKGKIRVTSSEAILDGKFWIKDMEAARDAFTVVKNMGANQEWSYGYNVLEAERGVFDEEPAQFLKRVDVYEASPVIRGAGIGTRTLSFKSLGDNPADLITKARNMSDYRAAVRPHETALSDHPWSGKALEVALGDNPGIVALRSTHAWCDPTGDPELKSSYAYPHHDGPGGPANVRACLMGIAKLNGATMSGAEIPDEDRRGVYNHLAAHLADADIPPSELTDGKGISAKFTDQLIAAIAFNQEIVERSGDVLALRRGKGRAAHAALNVQLLEWLLDSQKALRAQLDTPQEDAAREHVRFIQEQFRLQDLGV